ncbi:MAG TPA: sugar ABC transporter permease [Ruminococcaceae bacterium]|nr:sugar ABC transporter permease [Oscillospiraceae bacterium]
MALKTSKLINNIVLALIFVFVGVVLLFPIVWMFLATFKTNEEIFGTVALLPKSFSLDSYIQGWKGNGQVSYAKFFLNTFALVVPTTVLTVMSCSFVAYGFARFRFPFKKILFMILISTLMLPNSVIIIPRYTLFNKFGWINTYMPFYVPALLACYPFFIFMMVQFLRGLPKDLDESAYLDGCGTFRVFTQILLPLLKPALFSAALFQFLWTYNDYFNSLIFINSVKKYTISLALRMSLDAESIVIWSRVMAMSFLAVLPLIILFFLAQRYFVEGIATTGMKG